MSQSTYGARAAHDRTLRLAAGYLALAGLAGCAHIEFDAGNGLLYYEPVPYLLVSQGADCAVSATLLMLPGHKKYLRLAEGYGSADLKVTLSNGMITEVGQNVDNRIPETLASLATLKGAGFRDGCAGPAATLYPIVDGGLGKGKPLAPN